MIICALFLTQSLVQTFFCKVLMSFFSLKILWKNYVSFWQRNLKRTLQSARNLFSRKSDLKSCIIFNIPSFTNTQGSVNIRLACSKASLLINSFDPIL